MEDLADDSTLMLELKWFYEELRTPVLAIEDVRKRDVVPHDVLVAQVEQGRRINDLKSQIQDFQRLARENALSADRDEHRATKSERRFDGGLTDSVRVIVTAVGGVAGVTALIKAAQPMLVQWLKNRAGLSIKLKHSTGELTISGLSDLEQALEFLSHLPQQVISEADGASRLPTDAADTTAPKLKGVSRKVPHTRGGKAP